MSGLILPARSLLKPDRPVISPGWVGASLAGPRVRRWRDVLAGRAALNMMPGCCCGGPTCGGCDQTPRTMTISWTTSGNTACCVDDMGNPLAGSSGSASFTAWQLTPCQDVVAPCPFNDYPFINFPMVVALVCQFNVPALTVGGDCPSFSNSDSGCIGLVPDSYQCSPFLATYSTTGSSIVCGWCFDSFTVSE